MLTSVAYPSFPLNAGAYLGLLLQLKRLLEPSHCPVVAVLPPLDTTAKPDDKFGKPEAELRWKHPFFSDIQLNSFPEYHHVQPSKYAEKVSMQAAAWQLCTSVMGCWHCTRVVLHPRHPHVLDELCCCIV